MFIEGKGLYLSLEGHPSIVDMHDEELDLCMMMSLTYRSMRVS
jgi:hypothetical protein